MIEKFSSLKGFYCDGDGKCDKVKSSTKDASDKNVLVNIGKANVRKKC